MSAPQSETPPVIAVTGLTKHYTMGDSVVRALRSVAFRLSPGAFVAVMGPSGSGKTTLMDILGCLSRPTAGQYLLNGRSVVDLTERQLAQVRNRSLGFVFQNFNLLPRSSALDNVALPLLYSGVSRSDRLERAACALRDVGLEDRMHHRPNELSGGQRQRVAIARALVNEPEILIADEPTGNLDSVSGQSILELFGQIHRSGKTIIMVTHEREVAEHAERIMSFLDGQLVRDEWRNGNYWERTSLVG